jgi:hypothetical protein
MKDSAWGSSLRRARAQNRPLVMSISETSSACRAVVPFLRACRHAAARLAALAIGGALCAACGGSSPSTPTTPPSSAATTASVSVTGSAPDVGSEAPFKATATLSDGTTQDVTATATWTSANQAVATVSPAGIVRGVSAGQTSISASYQNVSGARPVTIAPRLCGTAPGTTNRQLALWTAPYQGAYRLTNYFDHEYPILALSALSMRGHAHESRWWPCRHRLHDADWNTNLCGCRRRGHLCGSRNTARVLGDGWANGQRLGHRDPSRFKWWQPVRLAVCSPVEARRTRRRDRHSRPADWSIRQRRVQYRPSPSSRGVALLGQQTHVYRPVRVGRSRSGSVGGSS